MGTPRAFWTHNSSECTNRIFSEYCEGLGIPRELTAPYTPQRNEFVGGTLASTFKTGLAASLKVDKLSPDVHLERVIGVWDRFKTQCWL